MAIRFRFNLLIVLGAISSFDNANAQDLRVVTQIEAGRRIYEDGLTLAGTPLVGTRPGGLRSQGAPAACANCHQRSGLGSREGATLVPPVTGQALFGSPRAVRGKTVLQPDQAAGRAVRQQRQAKGMQRTSNPFVDRPDYQDAALAQLLNLGINPAGYKLSALMPRYALAADDLAALSAYLRQLSVHPSPGVATTELDVTTELHVATVITAGQDPTRAHAMQQVLSACMAEKLPLRTDGGLGVRLHTWHLTGAAATWPQQLTAAYLQQPPFVMLSGLGGVDWEPVHQFCEAQKVPCLFPNVAAPGVTIEGGYNFYYSKGVDLEAAVGGQHIIRGAPSKGLRRVLLVGGADPASQRFVGLIQATITTATGAGSLVAEIVNVASDDGMATATGRMKMVSVDTAVVLALNEPELVRFTSTPAPRAAMVLMSGSLGGLERAPLNPAWRAMTEMIYPFDAPRLWDKRMDFNLRPWLREKAITHPDERMLGNTLAACNILVEAIGRARGHFVRERIVELVENYPTAMGNAPAPQAYPRFSLGPRQRYSSKGAYIVRFAKPDLERLEKVTDWIVP
jgi:Cytochrome c